MAEETVSGSFEIHVFAAPLDPPDEAVERFRAACATDDGVPQTAVEAARSRSDRYFDFHLLADGRHGPLTADDPEAIRDLGAHTAARLSRPVPASYNALEPAQRFLNLRARGVGLDEALAPVRELQQAIEAHGAYAVHKVIAEYIRFDSNRAVDDGWLAP